MRMQRLPDVHIPDDLGAFYNDLVRRIGHGRTQSMMYRNRAQRARMDRIVDMVADLAPWSCLEVGCAEGMMTVRLAEACGAVDAMDISAEMLRGCPPHPRVRYFQADAAEYTPERDYDLILLCEVLEHVRDPEDVIARYSEHASYLLASGPVTEFPNPNAFDAHRIGRESTAGDASGHIWTMDYEGFVSWFDDLDIIDATRVHHSGIVLCRGRSCA